MRCCSGLLSLDLMGMVLIGSYLRAASWIAVLGLTTLGAAQHRVVTTIPDFSDLAQRIGGDAVKVSSLTKGHEDLHLVRIRPSLLIRLRAADAFVQLGLDGEHSWVPALMRAARNDKIRPGQPGFCNASRGVTPLEVPEIVSRGAGPDLHPNGNPHYNLDPTRMRIAARNIRDCLIRLDPSERALFTQRCAAWEKELDGHLVEWRRKLAPFRGAEFIEAHSAWVYFAETFDLRIAARLEPSPGMVPTPGHLAKVIRLAKKRGVGLVVGRLAYADVGRRVAEATGAKAAILQISSSSSGKYKGWFTYMSHVVDTFAGSLRKPRSKQRAGATVGK